MFLESITTKNNGKKLPTVVVATFEVSVPHHLSDTAHDSNHTQVDQGFQAARTPQVPVQKLESIGRDRSLGKVMYLVNSPLVLLVLPVIFMSSQQTLSV